MTVSSDFLEYILDQFPAWGEVTVRWMFGGRVSTIQTVPKQTNTPAIF